MAGGWTFHGGARLDWARSTADETEAPLNLYEAYHETQATAREDFIPSGNVRLVWKNDDGVEFGAGLGRTGRVPEPNERWFGLRRSGTDWVGNPGLEPSLNTGVSLSLSVRRAGRFVGASLFGQQIDDFIVVYGQPRRQTVPGVMNTLARSYTNNDATLWGGEISGALPITRQLSIAGDLSYVRGTQDEDPGRGITSRDLAEMPPLRLRTSMRFNAARGWAEVEAVFSSAQNRVDQDLLEESTPAWGVAHVACGAQWRELDFTLGVSNVFNRLYAEHLSYQRDPYRSGVQVNEPGRSIFGNVSYRF
jgi:iron complex outermembrane receptor protein